ncbi:hypothetical protein PLESTM_001741500 [Pleodorina starrii]|nr:hypothetical protein PLESTM_001741500 [Pleodorina starrii]
MTPQSNAGFPAASPSLASKRFIPVISSKCRPVLTGGRRPNRSPAALPYTVAAEPAGASSPSVAEPARELTDQTDVRDPNAPVSNGPSKGAVDARSGTVSAAERSAGRQTNGDGTNGIAAATAPVPPPLLLQPSSSARSSGAATQGPNMLLLPVAVCKTITLSPQATLADGVMELLRRLPAAIADHAALPSGVVRLEVAVPRTATTALRWLSGQTQQQPQPPGHQQPEAAGSPSPAAVGPFLYFSGRRSSAPDTPGAAAAEAATRGWSSLAGAGAAWRWWGPGGGGFDSRVVSALQRFLSPDQPRVRILGGVRFDPRRAPDPEWAPFGSHCFVLPLLELTEAEDACLLAVTLAWDPAAAADAAAAERGPIPAAGGFSGCASLAEAAARAEAALRLMRPPAPASAYGLRVSRSDPQHCPSRPEWDAHMAALLGGLQEGGDTGGPAAAAAALASLLDTGLARQEYLTHGQQGLDDLLAAVTLSASTAKSAAVRQPADGDVGDGLDALRDLIDGKATVSELAAAARGGGGGAAAGAAVAAAAAAAATAAEAPSAGSGGGGSGAQQEAAEELSKVVMARRTTMQIGGPLDPLHVLLSLQERDPRAYQLYFAPGDGGFGASHSDSPGPRPRPGPGSAFLACTPERLYARTGRFVASEAVAGTRPRGKGGDVEQDFWLSLDLLRSAKDHAEFCTVRDWIASQLEGPCEDVVVEIRKSVLKQGSVQHLFGRVAAALRRGRNDAHLLAALHPTPAVCGRPREAALGYLDELEAFDRGWYAGPFGWISGAGAEFVVAIRSGLVCPSDPTTAVAAAAGSSETIAAPPPAPPQLALPVPVPVPAPGPPSWLVHMFAGVGVVRGSDPSAEWQELDLKIRPLSSALLPAPPPSSAPNVNVAWAGLLVEELCRLGVNMFCVAPGSRSSPLTHAIAAHPRARLNVCIDERSLGFWALGYGRACPGRPAAVITSSGTAVANLLPAVVEASLSGVPLLLLTADRPAELRDTAANQTIDQTKIFGGFTRWFFDLPPPAADIPGRTVLTAASTAFRAAVASAPPGPVHLNLQFREPLAPVSAPWSPGPFMAGLTAWQASQLPYTSHISAAALPGAQPSGIGGGAAAGSGSGSMYGIGGSEVAALQSLLRGARRGLVVVGELIDPRDIVAARQIGSALGWPVVADVLSGLRVGAAPPTTPQHDPPATPTPTPTPTTDTPTTAVPLVHHMDHLLLGDRRWWGALRPDVILQLGPHLTSKRIGQFLDWAAMGGGEGAPAVPWVYVAPHTLRHDPSHLISHRAVMGLTEFRDAVVGPAAAAAAASGAAVAGAEVRRRGGVTDPWVHMSDYGRMLLQLDEAVSHEIDSALDSLDSVSEPFIARTLARCLPAGHGLFIGNSMPIRDMDMYAAPQQQPQLGPRPAAAAAGAAGSRRLGSGGSGGGGSGGAVVGVPVAANRGASGIDGVLSTAAGFAEGLSRPATLLVGDLSFLHDINGLNLLRAGELRPPLTVVLINNSGGGIFSFLPIAGSVPEEEFTPLWATPQNVDLEAMCRAQGIPHQKVNSPEALVPALQAAWGLNRHSVVEVITDRTTNVDLHRRVQAAALRAAQHCHWLTTKLEAAAETTAAAADEAAAMAATSPSLLSSASALPTHITHTTHTTQTTTTSGGVSSSSSSSSSGGSCPLTVGELHWRRYRLPLARPLTTTTTTTNKSSSGLAAAGSGAGTGSGGGGEVGLGDREGLLVRLVLRRPDGSVAGEGVGEVAPLPGLHSETLEEAEVQVAALSSLLPGVPVPPSLALLGGRLAAWLSATAGLDLHTPASHTPWLAPSVRFGLESALLSALAGALRVTLAELLAPPGQAAATAAAAGGAAPAGAVLLNGLVSPPVSGDDAADAAAAAAAAAALVSEGCTAVKVKVARRSDPEADAVVLAAIRSAVGPHVVLRADANRGWKGLAAAVAFGRAVAAAGVGLQYVEEPTADPRDMAAFYAETGVPVAADESLDEGLLMGPPAVDSGAVRTPTPGGAAAATSGSYSAAGLPADRAAGLAAVVVKPSVVGGLEAAAEVAQWAQRRGVQTVISSAFESSVGLAGLLQLAAAVDAAAAAGGGGGGGAVHHGLGTLQWFAADVAAEPLQVAPQLLTTSTAAAAASAASAAAAKSTAGGDFVPLQALCGTVEQADRLLRACASGRGLRRDVLVEHPHHHHPHHPSVRPAAESEGPSHTETGSNGTASPSDITRSSRSRSRNSSSSRAGTAPSADGAASAATDPWVGQDALGGVLERPILVEVALAPPTEVSAATAAAEPTDLPVVHPSHHSHSHHHYHHSHHHPHHHQIVQVRGLELLPPTASCSSGSSSSLGRDETQHPANGSVDCMAATSVSGNGAGIQSHGHGHQQRRSQQRRRPFVFLHGFLGGCTDWLPLMRSLAAAGHRCVALDLPGHGGTLPDTRPGGGAGGSGDGADGGGGGVGEAGGWSAAHSISGAAACVSAAARRLGLEGAVLVGYSLGARVALQAALDEGCTASASSNSSSSQGSGSAANGNGNGNGSSSSSGSAAPEAALWSGVVLVSGTPGIKDPAQAAARAANDDRLAGALLQGGLEDFVRRWYEQPLWASLRRHPAFGRMLQRRLASASASAFASAEPAGCTAAPDGTAAAAPGGGVGGDEAAAQLAAALRGMSTGRMAPLWDRLDPWVGPPVVLVVGDLDAKFVDINTHTLARLVRQRTTAAAATVTAAAGAGEAAVGSPPALVQPLQQQQAVRGGGGAMVVSEQLRQLGHALVRMEGVGHAVHVEAPERLVEVLREAVGSLEQQPQRQH